MPANSGASLFAELVKVFERVKGAAGQKKELLARLEPLNHNSRVRQMIWLGMAAFEKECSDAEVLKRLKSIVPETRAQIKACLSSMESDDFYERYLSLYSCYGSRDSERVVRSMSDKSQTIRNFALKLAPCVCEDAHLRDLLLSQPLKTRHKLVHGLRYWNRVDVIDRFLTTIQDSAAEDFSRLLPFGSASLIEGEWTKVESGWNDVDWGRLTRNHTDLALAKIRSKVATTDCFDPRLIWIANASLRSLRNKKPLAGIGLIKDLLKHASLQQIYLEGPIRTYPDEIVKLALEGSEDIKIDLGNVIHRLSEGLVPQLLRRQQPTYWHTEYWFKRITPRLRTELFNEFADGWRDNNGCISYSLLGQLPTELREEQGRLHLSLESISASPQIRVLYAQLLPWNEAKGFTASYLANPDGALRAVAMTALVRSIRYNRGNAGELLEFLRSKKNEQDPVRMAWLGALSQTPPSIWKQEHLDLLGGVFRDALDAKDLSYSSQSYIAMHLVKLVPFHPEWSAKWIATLLKERPQMLPGAGERLNKEHVQALSAVLLPVLKSWQTKEREYHLIQLAQCFGERLEDFDSLSEIIKDLVFKGSSSHTREMALNILYQRRLRVFDELLEKLLKDDPTWSTRHYVNDHLHRRRQDLLTPFLGQNAYKGRFGTGALRVVPNYESGFSRWTREQRKIFVKGLVDMTGGKDRSVSDVFYALHRLSAVQEAPLDVVLKFARLNVENDPEKLVLRDYAIQCLSRFDASEGFDELINCLSDQRARIAVYSLNNAIKTVSYSRAFEILKNVPREKVTVAKETIRLIGTLRSDETFEYLLEVDREDLHKDVRIALLRALWDYLERDASWEVLARAAKSEDKWSAIYVTRTPDKHLSERGQERLLNLLSVTLAHENAEVRMSTLQRCTAMPVLDRKGLLYEAILVAAESGIPREHEIATRALAATYAIRDVKRIGEAVTRLMEKRRNLTSLINALIAQQVISAARALPVLRTALTALSKDSKTIVLQSRLAAQSLPWDEFIAFVRTLNSDGLLHAEALSAIVSSIEKSHRMDAPLLHIVEESLSAESDETLRRIGLAALIGLSDGNRGWTPERIERLKHFRDDSSALVAGAAQFTFPSGELVHASVS